MMLAPQISSLLVEQRGLLLFSSKCISVRSVSWFGGDWLLLCSSRRRHDDVEQANAEAGDGERRHRGRKMAFTPAPCLAVI